MRIGYIVQDFPPEVGAGPARVTELGSRWLEAGASVTFLTGMPTRRIPGRVGGETPSEYRGRVFLDEQFQGMRVLRSWVFNTRRGGFVTTMANNASFMVSGAVHGLARVRDVDVIIASSPPFLPHLTGALLSRARRVPLVLELRDLWPDYLVQMGLLASDSIAARTLFAVERRLLRSAAAIVVVTESFKERVARKGVAAERISVIPNGVDLDLYRQNGAGVAFEDASIEPGDIVIGYLGTFGAGQGLTTILDAAAILADLDPRVKIFLVGDGPQRTQIEAVARERALRNVIIRPPIERAATRDFYNACTACLVPLAPIPIFQETVPSKLFEIMACETPVVASVAGEARHIVQQSGAGLAVQPGDAAEIARAVKTMADTPAHVRREMGARGRAYVRQHYSRSVLAQNYLDLLCDVTRQPGSYPRSALPAFEHAMGSEL